jgi:hypothetical protein
MCRHCESPTQTFVDRIQLARVVRMFALPSGGRGNIGARGLAVRAASNLNRGSVDGRRESPFAPARAIVNDPKEWGFSPIHA